MELQQEKLKQRSDGFQTSFNEKVISLEKAQALLSNANKIVRHKDNIINQH